MFFFFKIFFELELLLLSNKYFDFFINFEFLICLVFSSFILKFCFSLLVLLDIEDNLFFDVFILVCDLLLILFIFKGKEKVFME